MATQKEVADLLDISERQVRNLQNKGVIPKPRGRGGLDLKTCVHSYINFLRNGGNVDEALDGKEEKEESHDDRLKRIRADTLEFKLQVEQRNFAPVGVLSVALEQVVSLVVPKLAAIPAIIRRTSPEIRPSTIEKVQAEIATLQNSLQAVELTLPDDDEFDLSECEAFVIAAKDEAAEISG